MQASSSELLQWDDLHALLVRYVHSPLGRAELAATAPSSDRAAVEDRLADVAEAVAYVASTQKQPGNHSPHGRIRFDSIDDPRQALIAVRIEGAVLDGLQLRQLFHLLEQAADLRGVILSAALRFPRLSRAASELADLRPLVRGMSGKILPDGSLSDDASVALGRLRREIEKGKKSIRTSLENFLRSHRGDGALREDFVTVRDDRFVVPIVAGQQRKVDGVIHGTSGTGQTLFVEPLETIGLNNDLVRLRDEEASEQHRILADFTARLRPESAAIAATAHTMGRLELLFALADFAADFDCCIPVFSPPETRRLVLELARHPLLEDVLRSRRLPIVPVSLSLDENCRTLLISGPNTGGKTVAMKTTGLLALMAHAGLPVPAARAEFPLFDQILADIGDNQSIEESLSSFSAHIAHVHQMLDAATPDTLVLLDELGRATDPEEGGALGVAMLDSFRQRGVFTIASTHLLALKVYGATTPGVLNGSMGFNDETLQPTYVLRLGAPGKSAGLDIAARLGLPSSLIDRARAAMSSQERDLARLVTELHQRLEATRQLQDDLTARIHETAAREHSLTEDAARREKAKLRELESRGEQALAAFESRARETIEELAQTGEQRKTAARAELKVAKARREMREELRRTISPEPAAPNLSPGIEEGARVRLRGVREPAVVRRVLANGRFEVQAGLMKMQVGADDIEQTLAPSASPTSSLPRNVSYQPAGPSWDVSYREINVIGRNAEDAVAEVDKFLDSASMASIDRVRIVHGHGMGILKRAVAALLGSNPHVENFYPASPAEGGAGATVVELK